MNQAARYVKLVEWSDEDQCYVGSCPGLFYGGCHGDDEQAVFAELCQIVEETVRLYESEERPLPPATSGYDWANRMTTLSPPLLVVFLTLVLTWHTPAVAQTLQKSASWQPATEPQMHQAIGELADRSNVSQSTRNAMQVAIQKRLDQPPADVLSAIVEATAMAIPEIATLQQQTLSNPLLAGHRYATGEADSTVFARLPAPVDGTVRTWLARELVRARLFDEALPYIADLSVSDTLDPASLLFYRSVCRHSLLMKQETLGDLRQLLEQESILPTRFARTAQMMLADIKPLEDDSLDEISRRMTDVTRRLGLGRAGDEVQTREQEIIDKLSKLIEDLEQQQQQQQQQQQSQQQSQGGARPQRGSQAMGDNRVTDAGLPPDGKRRNFQRDGWENLPPAEREEALQQISRDLPTHYREAIEAYFRRLATANE